MHHYLIQLLLDLETIAANPPEAPWFKDANIQQQDYYRIRENTVLRSLQSK